MKILKFKKPVKISEITSEHIEFSDGTIIYGEHRQDCCEQVYADFKSLVDTAITELEFRELEIEPVADAGFRINGFFVPCYNIQNGYYLDKLDLIIGHKGMQIKINLNDFDGVYCLEDDIK